MLQLHRYSTALLHAFALIPVFSKFFSKAEVAILCEDCNGRGWLLCDFCKGQKTNVKSETNRIYGRCPSCRTDDEGPKRALFGSRSQDCRAIGERTCWTC